MRFGESRRAYIDRRVAERLAATGEPSFRDWFARLRSDAAELQQAVNLFTVNETYFYREAYQLRCLTRALLPALVAGREAGGRVRLWSNPCSTGEEAYSIALWLLEEWPMVDAFNVEIIGSDIDSLALAAAREGLYQARAVERLPPAVLRDYFRPEGAGWRLIPDLRESVAFHPANLVDRQSMAAQGRFDVIFCRNVLIYFDDASRRTAAELLYDALAPGGFLLLGHAESMQRIDDRFVVRRFEETVVYQRPPDA
jgi:chemotaxis protein methyltransferase CheR